MTTQHTPGPWVAKHENFAYQIRGVFKKSKNSFVTINHWADSDYGSSKSEAEANARLIAAAPELLEALLLFVNHGTCFDELDMSKARAAIAKATGQHEP